MSEPRQENQSISRSTQCLVAAAIASILTWLVAHISIDWHYSDAGYYLLMAQGQAEQVMKPFSYRVLNPWLVNRIATVWSMPIESAFHYISLGWTWILAFSLAFALLPLRRSVAAASLAGVFLLPFQARLFRLGVLPDLSHAALLSVYFLLLRARMWWQASIFLVLLYLDRESTIVLAVAAVIILWIREGRKVGLIHAASAALGVAFSSFAAAHSMGNRHALSNMLYTLGKVPWNFSQNVLGIQLWTNTFPGTPTHVWQVPSWLHLGQIHAVGVLGWAPDLIYNTLSHLAATFGIGALLLCFVCLRRNLLSLASGESWLLLAGIYGFVCFALSPVLGTGVDRLVGYGWPLFLLWLPYQVQQFVPAKCISMWRVLAVLALNASAAWAIDPSIYAAVHVFTAWSQLFGVIAVLLALAWILLRPVFRCASAETSRF